MTRDRKFDLALLATGGVLVLVGEAVSKDRERKNVALTVSLSGLACLAVGVGRVTNFRPNYAILAGVTVAGIAAGFWVSSKNKLDPATKDAVRTALSKENDPAILHEFALKLREAGHTRAADVVEKRAVEIAPAARVGQAPSAISEAQARLSDLGYVVPQDGRLGSETVLALKRFQSLYDLDIDGQVTAETLAALRRATTH